MGSLQRGEGERAADAQEAGLGWRTRVLRVPLTFCQVPMRGASEAGVSTGAGAGAAPAVSACTPGGEESRGLGVAPSRAGSGVAGGGRNLLGPGSGVGGGGGCLVWRRRSRGRGVAAGVPALQARRTHLHADQPGAGLLDERGRDDQALVQPEQVGAHSAGRGRGRARRFEGSGRGGGSACPRPLRRLHQGVLGSQRLLALYPLPVAADCAQRDTNDSSGSARRDSAQTGPSTP
jgi:hypothetical protein